MLQDKVFDHYNPFLPEFQASDSKSILIDFEKPPYYDHDLKSLLSKVPDDSIVFVNFLFPTPHLLEILFLIATISRKNSIFLSVNFITEKGYIFLKKIGLIDLSTASIYCPPLVAGKQIIIQNNRCSELLDTGFYELSNAEIEILFLISKGLSNQHISKFICRSYHTVKNHKINISRKLGLPSCSEIPIFIDRVRNTNVF